MALGSFREFCACIGELSGGGTPRIDRLGATVHSANLHLRGVTINAVQFSLGGDSQVFLATQTGAPAALEVDAGSAWQSLLDANSVLPDLDSPRFSRNPMTGDVTLQWPCPLLDMTPLGAYQRANHMADVVLHWQNHRVVHPDLLTPGRGGTGPDELDDAQALDAAWRFRDLYRSLCDMLGQPALPGPDGTQTFSFSLHFHEVEVVVAHLPRRRPHAALVGVPLGRREPGEQSVAEAMAMLDANFALAGQPHGAAFSRDPGSGELLLRYAYPLEGACGRHCLTQMAGLATFAREWKASAIAAGSAGVQPGVMLGSDVFA